MFRIEELELQLACTYATKITESTKMRRLTDITALQTMIGDAIASNALIHQSKEPAFISFIQMLKEIMPK